MNTDFLLCLVCIHVIAVCFAKAIDIPSCCFGICTSYTPEDAMQTSIVMDGNKRRRFWNVTFPFLNKMIFIQKPEKKSQ
jgi:hypothetical protein